MEKALSVQGIKYSVNCLDYIVDQKTPAFEII